jgi:predicted PhzF superfamily epimerase YddE/YHI9
MDVTLYQIDAFTDRLFAGNPAAVCPLDHWLADDVMQAIAAENNLSETAFVVPQGDAYGLRWFTPAVEVDLCGHATLATAFVILTRLAADRDAVSFDTRSGRLTVHRGAAGLVMDFPVLPVQDAIDPADPNVAGLGRTPVELHRIREAHGAPYCLAIYDDEADVATLTPNFAALGANVIATAPGDTVDFVSRFFAPLSGIDEDPVTGSAHCTLTPYWAGRLGKSELRARQISARGGDIGCRLDGERVFLSGKCVAYMEGRIAVPD